MTTLKKVDDTLSLLDQAEVIVDYPPEIQQTWLLSLGQILMSWEDLTDMTIMIQNRILYITASVWDKFSKDATYKWEWDYYIWAKAFTKRRGKDPAKETIDNRITVYRDWVALETIEYPNEVDMPERDEAGRPTGQIIKVDFDPAQCDYSKLLVARGTAKRGEMTPQSWSLLMDPHATVRQLEESIGLGSKEPPQDDNADLKFIEEGGIIYGVKFGHEVAIMETLFENDTDPLFKEAVGHIYSMMGLEVPFELRL